MKMGLFKTLKEMRVSSSIEFAMAQWETFRTRAVLDTATNIVQAVNDKYLTLSGVKLVVFLQMNEMLGEKDKVSELPYMLYTDPLFANFSE